MVLTHVCLARVGVAAIVVGIEVVVMMGQMVIGGDHVVSLLSGPVSCC